MQPCVQLRLLLVEDGNAYHVGRAVTHLVCYDDRDVCLVNTLKSDISPSAIWVIAVVKDPTNCIAASSNCRAAWFVQSCCSDFATPCLS